MDKIFIHHLRVPAMVGILPAEKAGVQTVDISLEFVINTKQAAKFDQITEAVDYAAVRSTIIDFAKEHRFNLLETMADKLASVLMKDFSLIGLRLTIAKPTIFTDAAGVGVIIERGAINDYCS